MLILEVSVLNILTQISLVYLASIGTDLVLYQENLGDLVAFTQGYAAPRHIAARASRLEASASQSLAADAGSDQGAPSSGHVTQADLERGIELMREDTRRLKEKSRRTEAETRQIEARIAEKEKNIRILQARLQETSACLAALDNFMMKYKAKHSSGETSSKAKQLIEDYRKFYDNPGLPCPVNAGTPW